MANAEHEEAISVHAGAQDLPENGNIDKIRDILSELRAASSRSGWPGSTSA